MDLEARSLPASVKTPLLTKLRDYKASLTKLKADVKTAAGGPSGDAARDELLSRAELGDEAGGAAGSSAQRERLLSATDRLKATGARIQEGKKTLLETEELGVSILQDLHKQRETIVRTRDTLHTADDNIGKSRRILSSMAKRAMANKVMLFAIIGILIMCIALIGALGLCGIDLAGWTDAGVPPVYVKTSGNSG